MVLLLFWLGMKLAMPPLYFVVLGTVYLCKILKIMKDNPPKDET